MSSSTLEIEFKQAQDFIQNAPAENEPSNEQKLQFYALFKQATQGQVTGKRPGAFDLINRAKYDAWKKVSTLTKEEAMKSYITTLEQSSPNWRSHFNTSNTTTTSTTTSSTPVNPTTTTSNTSTTTTNNNNNNNDNIGLITNIDNEVYKKDILRGKVIIVTGGGSGICYGITQYLNLYGAHTVIISRTLSKLEKAANEIMKISNNSTICLPLSADVRDYKALSLAIDKVIEKFGRIDGLVNGSAGNFLCPASQLTPGGFKTVMEIDTFGTFNASKIVYDKYMKQYGGNIINLSMTLHNTATIMQVHAGCAKSAIDTMTKHLAVEWGLDNVRLNSIQIGPIEGTEGFSRLLPQDELKRYKEMIPLQRFGLPIDIARMVLFLLSDASSYITGAIIPVEGASQFTTSNIYGYPNSLKISKM